MKNRKRGARPVGTLLNTSADINANINNARDEEFRV
jgi:hypothetical protein